jgi:hypothetical protein
VATLVSILVYLLAKKPHSISLVVSLPKSRDFILSHPGPILTHHQNPHNPAQEPISTGPEVEITTSLTLFHSHPLCGPHAVLHQLSTSILKFVFLRLALLLRARSRMTLLMARSLSNLVSIGRLVSWWLFPSVRSDGWVRVFYWSCCILG